MNSLLGAMQAYHSQHIQNMKYACLSNIISNMSRNLQELLFQYCEIYHIRISFYDIHLFPLGTP